MSNWKGGIYFKRGYVFIHFPNHPHQSARYVKRSRLEMEKKLGRYLNSDELVHHINGIRDDDRIENLVLITRSAHTKLHLIQDGPRKIKKPPHSHTCNFCKRVFSCETRGKHTPKFCSHSCSVKSHKRGSHGRFIS